MYFEKSRSFVSRHGWTFAHTGAALEDRALALYEDHKRLETKERSLIASLLQDPRIHHEDERVIDARNSILKHGKLREQCAVWAHEFGRTPEREFTLGIEDVSFFRIFGVGGEAEPHEASNSRHNWKFTYRCRELVEPLLEKHLEVKAYLKVEEKREAEGEMQEILILAEEFKKNQDRNIHLALGDVVYFNLAPLLKRTEEE